MTEMMWCIVTVKVPESWGRHSDEPPWMLAGLGDECEGLEIDYGGGAPVSANLWRFSGEWNYGVGGDSLGRHLKLLRDQHIPYYAADDGKYELHGQVEVYDGFDLHGGSGNTDGANISLAKLEELGSYQAALDHLRRLDGGINVFPVMHLPPHPPPQP